MLHLDYHIHFKKKDMKKIIQLITICLVITSCDFQKVTDLQDDFEIKVTAEPVLSRVDIKVFNSKDGSDISENINLSFSGQELSVGSTGSIISTPTSTKEGGRPKRMSNCLNRS